MRPLQDTGIAAPWADGEISGQEFQLIQRLVKEHTGIALGEHKRSLVASRLGKRLRALRLGSFRSYYEYLMGERGATELENFVNAMTTNKTDFYRERAHFDFLQREVIPAWKARAVRAGERRVRIWSAGCSTGEEPYTIALTLCEGLGSLLSWDVRILASDIDTSVLAHAAEGVYPRERVGDIPAPLLHRYFLQGTGDNAHLVKVGRGIRSLVTFRRVNFQDDPWPIHTLFDCIFCRNVIIYFDKPTQHRLMQRFAAYLKDDGLLFLGHSESLYGICDHFAFLHNTIYRKAADTESSARAAGTRA
jgi:chemotaxis protein methyltransferase CheR